MQYTFTEKSQTEEQKEVKKSHMILVTRGNHC